ncbi:glycosyltransferase family 2 protein [Acetobacter sp.]|uniref:glycosyltransferase family 2 protein n=1 Tax=Acetobacter sp. TaxID=440 RepID=UPI0025C06D01|nr:glycosyltransferase family 2 protein [Acetobacter sp.]MCH4091660.1 glycosyltransferase family 2 protein [Acetobacter sp.]MCI1300922.1 glycosyltransferase family 2 protein [Acetobacter sp.]MCI1316201.1 glycosyltransferase family 2 protein [Acetobacter sp.]
MKIACALFVKNEIHDITGWIAWHFAIGINHLYIFDDHSDDGTWEVIQAASQIYSIESYRTNIKKERNFYHRQGQSFNSAVEKARGVFDWLGFLDGDEYLYINDFTNAADFFAQKKFENADGIAISWCVYGSNDKVIANNKLNIDQFTKYNVNAPDPDGFGLVKSFVRPEKVDFDYSNPHRLNVNEERYLDESGDVVEWRGTTKKINWDHAKVMHFICRSMEHYVSRIKRRVNADLSDSIGYWNHFNVNDADDFAPLSFSKNARNIMLRINRARFFDALKHACIFPYKNYRMISLSDHVVYRTEPADDVDVFEIRNKNGDTLNLNPFGRISSEPGEKVYLRKLKGNNDFYSFFQKSCESIAISNDTGSLSSFCVVVEDAGDDHVSIRNPYEYSYLTSPPSHCDDSEVSFSAKKILDWEKYTLNKIDYDGKVPCSSISVNNEIGLDDFIHTLRNNIGTMTVSDFCVCLASVADSDILTLKSCMRNLIPYT